MFDAALLSMDTKTIDKARYMDPGVSKHVTWDVTNTRNIHRIETSKVRSAGGQSHSVEGSVSFQYNGEIKTISDVLYVSGVSKNLLSVGSTNDKGCLVWFGLNQCWIVNAKDTSQVIATCIRDPKQRVV